MSHLDHSIFLPRTKPLPTISCSWITMQQSGLLVHKFWYPSRIDARGNKNLVLSLEVVNRSLLSMEMKIMELR